MAAPEREEQAAEIGANAESRSAPVALRKQQGYSKDRSSLQGNAEAERLALLRKENSECRRKREREEERQRKHHQDMAEAWQKHKQDEVSRKREERKARLAKLQAQNEERLLRQAQRSREAVYDDPEYHMLLEKYGDKVRVPVAVGRFAMDHNSHAESMESSRSLPRKPRVPKAKAKAGERKPGLEDPLSKAATNNGTLPPLAVSGGNVAVDALIGDSIGELSEAERPLMPRKERLRKIQQAILKTTPVSFYKAHMKRQLRRILEATEVTCSDHNARREQASWNLAKPLSIAEIKQLNGVGVRQP